MHEVYTVVKGLNVNDFRCSDIFGTEIFRRFYNSNIFYFNEVSKVERSISSIVRTVRPLTSILQWWAILGSQ